MPSSAVNAQSTGEQAVILLTIDSPQWVVPVRLCNDYAAVTSRGNQFQPFPFELELPSQEAGKPPRARITVSNVTREITQQIIDLTDSPTVLIEVVLYSAPDTVIKSAANMVLESPRWDARTIQADLALRDITQEPAAKDRVTPSKFPAAFG